MVRVQEGLSIAELFIILALVFVLAALAIPRILNSRMVVAEDSALVSLATINQAQTAYAERFPQIGFAARLSDLGAPPRGCSGSPSPAQACLIYFALAHADQQELNGYRFKVFSEDNASPRRSYLVVAVPAKYGETGRRTFCSTEDHILHQRDLGYPPTLESITRQVCQEFAR